MGIESFGGYLKKSFYSCISDKKPDNIKSLFIDANGIFYDAYKLFKPSDITDKEKEKLMKLSAQQIENKIINYSKDILENIIIQFKPTDNLVVAIDGLANAAKMQQQKTRRYSKPSEDDKIFNKRVFTPGTEIMRKLDVVFEKVVRAQTNIKNIIYSSHLSPGEAEHKIFDYIRANKIVVSTQGNHILHGADSDLLVLSAVSSFRNIFIYRQNVEMFYDIEEFKKVILKKLRRTGKVDKQIVYQDFVLLTYFIGNDFLPRFPNLPSVSDTMELVIRIYSRVDKNLSDSKGNIIWSNFYNLLNCLDKWKRDGLNLYAYNFAHPLRYPYDILRDNITLTDTNGEVVVGALDVSKHRIHFNMNNFALDWYNKQFKPKNIILAKQYNKEEFFSTKDIIKMVIKYLQAFQWVLKYYLYGPKKVPNSFYYPYKYTPLTLSVVNYLKSIMKNNKLDILNKVMERDNYPFNVVHQLMMVIPPPSIDIIPAAFRDIYRRELASVSPVDYPEPKPEGTDADYTAKPDIPPINPVLTLNALRGIKLGPEFTEKEDLFISHTVDDSNEMESLSIGDKLLM